ncbi:PR domain zinc finger protein 16 [Liparis tanakae]|uniref:PR domain zinc finger protein 16 n=1 Tax=Liparis tanakae TaxID=230148 RepID=A0A4Z2IFK3_9TELE|nr:PR domain zinc finger protein 16 [Liparis tanakae]
MKDGIFPEGSMAPNLQDEQMYRCEDCDELFSSTLELRRHQKYSCSSTGSIFDTLREDFKQEREDSDEPVHECKDCEKIFPNEYRYAYALYQFLPLFYYFRCTHSTQSIYPLGCDL